MHFQEYIAGQHQDSYQNLISAKEKLLSDIAYKRNKGNLLSLETDLKNLFYPPKGDLQVQARAQKYANAIAQLYEEISGKKLKNFHPGDVQYQVERSENINTKISKTNIKASQKSVNLARLKTEINKLLTTIQGLQNSKNNSQDMIQSLRNYKTTLKKCQKMIGSWENQIKSSGKNVTMIGPQYHKDIFNTDVLQDQGQVLEHIEQVGKALSQFVVTPQEYGAILEYAIELLQTNILETEEEITDDIIKDLAQSIGKTTGSQVVNRGGFNLNVSIDLKDFTTETRKKNKSTAEYFTLSDGQGSDLVFEFSPKLDGGGAKMGKVDVNLISNFSDTTGQNYRASLKNWKNSFDKETNFGQTSLFHALNRTGRSVLEDYVWKLQYPQTSVNGEAEILHEKYWNISKDIGKIVIYSDIIMGLSQGRQGSKGQLGYADTLIINDRIHKTIRVINISDAIFQALENRGNLYITDTYDEQALINNSRRLMKYCLLNKQNKITDNYRGLVYNYLNSIKVSVKFK